MSSEMTSDKISVLIVDDIPETRENLRKLLYFEPDILIAGMADNGLRAIDEAKRLQPDIVLMDINMPGMDGITATQEISRVAPMSLTIMMSVQGEKDYLQRAMMAGAKYFLIKPFTSEELSSAIHRVHEMGASSRAVVAMPPGVDGRGVGGRPGYFPGGFPPQPPAPEGKLVVIYSPKGGAGCSLVATNLAIALAQTTSQKVALVDASLQFGDAHVLLDLQGQHTLADAVNRLDELDSDLLNVLMSPHPSGIKVMAAPPSPVISEIVKPEAFKRILAQLKRDFDYILLDTWRHLDDILLTAIDMATRILLLITPEMPSIKSAKQFFELAEELKLPLDRIDLVLNKVVQRDGIRAEQIEGIIRHKILIQLDFEPRGVRQSINQGLPLILAQPNHPLAQSFRQLAQREVAILSPQPEEVAGASPGAGPDREAMAPSERAGRSGLFGRPKR